MVFQHKKCETLPFSEDSAFVCISTTSSTSRCLKLAVRCESDQKASHQAFGSSHGHKTSFPKWSANNGQTFFRLESLLHFSNGLKLMRGRVITLAPATVMLMRVLRNATSSWKHEGQMQGKKSKGRVKNSEADVKCK